MRVAHAALHKGFTVMSEHPHKLPQQTPGGRGISPALIVFVVIPLAGLAIALGVLLAEGGLPAASTLPAGPVSAPTQPLPSLNYPADNFTLDALDGESISLADYSGRVVFLNFWATWCVPCVRELPTFQAFAAEQNALDNGAVVLAVNNAENRDQISAFLTQNDIGLADVPVLLDSNSAVYRRFAVPVLPTTFVISPEGIVSHVKYGELRLAELYGYLETFTP